MSTFKLTSELRIEKRRSQFYGGDGTKEYLQQRWEDIETGKSRWRDVPMVHE